MQKELSLIFLNLEYENWQFSKSVCSIGIARIAVVMKLNIAVNIFNALIILGSEYDTGNIFRFSHIIETYFSSFYASKIAAKYEKRQKIDLFVRVNVHQLSYH